MTTTKASYKMQRLPPMDKASTVRAHRMLMVSDVKKSATNSPVQATCLKSKKMLRFQDVNEDDKENIFQPLCGSTPHGNRRHSASTPLIKSSEHKMLSLSHKKMMTPSSSREDKLDKSVHIPCLPNFLTPKGSRLLRSSSSKAKERSRKVKRLEQYFTSADRVNRAQGNLVNGGGRVPSRKDTPAPVQVKELNNNSQTMDDSVVAIIGRVAVSLSPTNDESKSAVLSNCSHDDSPMDVSPPRSLFCDSFNESTKMTLNDISQISQISSPHEQASSANLSGAFHSTFQYPLHSTFNYPLHSSFNFSNILPKEKPRINEGDKSEAQVSDCTCSSDESKNCTEIDVDEYEKTFCKSSYLSSDQDETCHNNTPCFASDSSDDPSSSTKVLKRQQGLAELSGTTQERSDPTGADSFFDITARLDRMAASGPSNLTQPSVLTTLPSCSEYEDYSRIKLNVTQNLGLMGNSTRNLSENTRVSRVSSNHHSSRKHRSSHGRHLGDGSSKPQYAKNCRSLSSHSRRISSHHDATRQVSDQSQRRYKSRNHGSHRTPQRTSRPMSNDSAYSSPSSSGCYTINDNTGCERRIVPGSSTSSLRLSHDQKKALAKKLKNFSGSFNRSKSGSSVGSKYEIKTLGHF